MPYCAGPRDRQTAPAPASKTLASPLAADHHAAMSDGELGWSVEARVGTAVVAPAGRVDETTASAFGERLADEVAAANASGLQRLAIDLGGIEYMSSRGLRALTLAQRRAKELGLTIVLAGANPVMREILAISRYDMVFKVFDRTEDALAG